MLITKGRRAVAAIAAVALLATAGCGDDKDDKPTAAGPTTVTYLPGFGIIGQDAYIYVAIEKGYFADAGLEVKVQPGAGTDKNLQVLLADQATFATVDMAGAVIAYSRAIEKGQQDQAAFKIISSVYQRSVSSITTLEGRGISGPKDLAGKTIGYQPGGVNFTLFPAYAQLAGLDAKTIKWQQAPPPQLRPLLASGQLDAITETVIGTPGVEAAAKGKKAKVLPYSDVLTDLYGNVIVATDKTIKEKPELVRAFREAALRGLVYAIEHPDEAGQIFNKHQNAYKAEVAAAETRLMTEYVRADGSDQVGALDSARVARTLALLQSLKQVQPGIKPEDVVDFSIATPYTPTT